MCCARRIGLAHEVFGYFRTAVTTLFDTQEFQSVTDRNLEDFGESPSPPNSSPLYGPGP